MKFYRFVIYLWGEEVADQLLVGGYCFWPPGVSGKPIVRYPIIDAHYLWMGSYAATVRRLHLIKRGKERYRVGY